MLGASLFEIAQSLFALERIFILGAMALNKNKSDEWTDKIQILSGSLMSNIRIKERSKNGWKTHKNARFVHILIKNYAKQRQIVVFSIFSMFYKLCVLELCGRNAARRGVGAREF